jgi:hypothetical protein
MRTKKLGRGEEGWVKRIQREARKRRREETDGMD